MRGVLGDPECLCGVGKERKGGRRGWRNQIIPVPGRAELSQNAHAQNAKSVCSKMTSGEQLQKLLFPERSHNHVLPSRSQKNAGN